MTKTIFEPLLRVLAILVASLCSPGVVNAATLMPATFAGQVQQTSEAGKVNGCGVTLVGLEQTQVGRVLVFNGSVVVFNYGVALVKGRVSETDAKAVASLSFKSHNLKVLGTKKVWMKAPMVEATTPVGAGVRASEDKGYILYGASLDAAYPVVKAVLDGEKIQVGFLTAGNKTEQVMFGVVSLSNDEKEQLNNCIRELTR